VIRCTHVTRRAPHHPRRWALSPARPAPPAPQAPVPVRPVWWGELTRREAEVLRCVARGMSNAEVAGELFVSVATVKSHVARLLVKVGARDRVQLVVAAYRTGFVSRTSEDPASASRRS